jgi:hypothetical protein
MRFTVIPDHFAPVFGPVVYEAEANAGERVTDVEVYNAATGELSGVKRFAGTGNAKANVAGYVRRMLEPRPLMPAVPQAGQRPPAGGFRFSQEGGRQAAVTVRAGDAAAPVRIFTCALGRSNEFDILSKMPQERMLAEGEWDEISIAVPDTSLSAVMTVTGGGADFTLRTGESASSRGVATLTVDAEDIAAAAEANNRRFADCRRAEVKIYAHDEHIGSVGYDLYVRGPGQRRICWLNSLGGIDYHTFHAVAQESLSVEKQRIFSNDGYRAVASAAERSSEMVSGYCGSPLADALAETVSSPRVWMAERGADGECAARPLDVVTDNVTFRDGELFCLRLTVREQSDVNCQNL